jgi:hypothetical protein
VNAGRWLAALIGATIGTLGSFVWQRWRRDVISELRAIRKALERDAHEQSTGGDSHPQGDA